MADKPKDVALEKSDPAVKKLIMYPPGCNNYCQWIWVESGGYWHKSCHGCSPYKYCNCPPSPGAAGDTTTTPCKDVYGSFPLDASTPPPYYPDADIAVLVGVQDFSNVDGRYSFAAIAKKDPVDGKGVQFSQGAWLIKIEKNSRGFPVGVNPSPRIDYSVNIFRRRYSAMVVLEELNVDSGKIEWKQYDLTVTAENPDAEVMTTTLVTKDYIVELMVEVPGLPPYQK